MVWGCARRAVSLDPSTLSAVLWTETFDELSNDRWREAEVRRRTEYAVTDLDGRRCLRAHSAAGASILLGPMPFDPNEHAWLSWDWRVDTMLQ
jgi:hypothetical protein